VSNLFAASPRQRLERKLRMIEGLAPDDNTARRFILAGLMATLDPTTLEKVGQAVADVLRKRMAEVSDAADS
jgi:hypothetical protein